MSDIAPFVAATLRDRVLQELVEENRELVEKNCALRADNRRLRAGPSWTVLVTGHDGSPVFASGTLTYREVIEELWIADNDGVGEIWVTVTLNEGEGGEVCRLDSVRDCWLVLKTEPGFGPDDVSHLTDPAFCYGVKACDGRLEIDWQLKGSVYYEVRVEAIIPLDRLDALDPELATGELVGNGDNLPSVLSLAEANAGGDAPVRFREVEISARVLLETVYQDEEAC